VTTIKERRGETKKTEKVERQAGEDEKKGEKRNHQPSMW
jgi:hypothetical protein